MEIWSTRVAALLGENPYESREKALKSLGTRKNQRQPFHPATDYGKRYEDYAMKLYEQQTGETVPKATRNKTVTHPLQLNWKGVIDGITETGRLVEIKCPYRRKISTNVPKYYWCQVQFLLELTGIDECDFVQYSPKQGLFVTVIKRDDKFCLVLEQKLLK